MKELCVTRGCINKPMEQEFVCAACYFKFTGDQALAEKKRNAMLGIHSYNKEKEIWFKGGGVTLYGGHDILTEVKRISK